MSSQIEELFDTMVQFGKLMSKNSTESHEEKEATMLQFSALRCLQEQKNIAVNELGSCLHMSKSSATQLIERLVKSGFIKRQEDKNDRRIIHLSLTPAGEEETTRLKNKFLQKIEVIFSHLPEHDIKELIRIHKLLLTKLEGK